MPKPAVPVNKTPPTSKSAAALLLNKLQVNDRIGECTITPSLQEKNVEESPQISIYQLFSSSFESSSPSQQPANGGQVWKKTKLPFENPSVPRRDFVTKVSKSPQDQSLSNAKNDFKKVCGKCKAVLGKDSRCYNCATKPQQQQQQLAGKRPVQPDGTQAAKSCKVIVVNSESSSLSSSTPTNTPSVINRNLEPACFTISDDEEDKLGTHSSGNKGGIMGFRLHSHPPLKRDQDGSGDQHLSIKAPPFPLTPVPPASHPFNSTAKAQKSFPPSDQHYPLHSTPRVGVKSTFQKPTPPIKAKQNYLSSNVPHWDNITRIDDDDEESDSDHNHYDMEDGEVLIHDENVDEPMDEDEEEEDEEDEDEDEDMEDEEEEETVDSNFLLCRSIRIGTLKINSSGSNSIPVLFTEEGLLLHVPALADGQQQLVSILLERENVSSVQVHFGKELPLLFFHTLPKGAASIRTLLNMSPSEKGPYYDPSSDDETKKWITILPQNIGESHRMFLWTLFAGQLEDLTQQKANEILVCSTPQNTAAVTLSNENLTEIRNYLLTKQAEQFEPRPDIGEKRAIVKLLTYPPPPQTGGITITTEDLECLNEGEFLNDVIIDFYLKYLFMEKLTEKDKARTHFFSTFFYTRLTQVPTGCTEEDSKMGQIRRHSQVKTWTRHVDIFEKDFIVIPVLQMSHWFLAIVCYPGLVPEVKLSPESPPPPPTPASSTPTASESDASLTTVSTITVSSSSSTLSMETSNPPPLVADESAEIKSLSPTEDPPAAAPIPAPIKEPLDASCSPPSNFSEASQEETAIQTPPASKSPIPCILLLDSFAGPSRWKIASTLREYLAVEWKVKKNSERAFDRTTMRAYAPRVPQQNNYFDCGVFVLQYVESFFETPPLMDFSGTQFSFEDWFSMEKVENKREELKELILTLKEKYNRPSSTSNNKKEESASS